MSFYIIAHDSIPLICFLCFLMYMLNIRYAGNLFLRVYSILAKRTAKNYCETCTVNVKYACLFGPNSYFQTLQNSEETFLCAYIEDKFN
ncbi:hypothetical protein SDC9_184581 [bioreactor metagenome]|uniref:Uncharacterized protein n=1 Tax=bioreactor metagenome TaxID=1076179 RepID=A0A645HDF2_9ZZZZ